MDAARKFPPAPAAPDRRAAKVHELLDRRRRSTLRQEALRLDRAEGARGTSETDRALLLWEGLVRGRLRLVDWFDADGRRLILIKPHSVTARCACGLTPREEQVAMSAALGESSKATGYRLGISPSRVSALLNASMRKLGVRTKAQLVVMVRVLDAQPRSDRVPSR